MRFALFATLFTASLAFTSARRISFDKRQAGAPPACSFLCFDDRLSSGTCPVGSNACLCRDQVFVNNVTACFRTNCSADDVRRATEFADGLCRAAGVNVPARTAEDPSTVTESDVPASTPAPVDPAATDSPATDTPATTADPSETVPPPVEAGSPSVDFPPEPTPTDGNAAPVEPFTAFAAHRRRHSRSF